MISQLPDPAIWASHLTARSKRKPSGLPTSNGPSSLHTFTHFPPIPIPLRFSALGGRNGQDDGSDSLPKSCRIR
jgi:hypothetical protein